MITEIHWYMVAAYVAISFSIAIIILQVNDRYSEKEVRISTVLDWTIETFFAAVVWPLFLIAICINQIFTKESKIRKWLNKINIVLWKRK